MSEFLRNLAESLNEPRVTIDHRGHHGAELRDTETGAWLTSTASVNAYACNAGVLDARTGDAIQPSPGEWEADL